MPEERIAIVGTSETFYFSHEAGRLCQWIMVTIESRLTEPMHGTVAIEAAGEKVLTSLEVAPGVAEYRCYAPTLWPIHAPVACASVRLAVGGETAFGTVSVGNHRPWTLYVLSDDCTDYTWVYASEEQMRADDAALTQAELNLAEATQDNPCRNRYNMAVGRQVEFYLERFPQHRERLFSHIRAGNVTLNPIFNMALTGDMSLEELIRQLYPARNWARDEGLDIGCANHQETPAITWAMATILAESGIRYLVKGNLPYECPWAERLEEPPVFLWEGPDGNQVLYRRRNTDYVEANFLLRDLRATNTALHTRVVPSYIELGERYPFSAIGLVGTYGDLSARLPELAVHKMAMIQAYNAQGWDYPRLVSASHKQFWNDIETQMVERHIDLPVYRGDYGIGWDAWPASLAYDFAAWRRAQERAGTADKLAAILSLLDPAWYAAHRETLAEAWMNLIYLADHAWNGANDANIELNARLRRRWQLAANAAFDAVINGGLAALGRRVPTGDQPQVLVFNGLGWERTGLIRAEGVAPGTRIVDVASGRAVPTQTVDEGGELAVYFEARDVPGIGYRTYAVEPGQGEQVATAPFQSGQNRLEGPFYAVEVSPVTGGIVSLYDKVRGKELVDPNSPYHLNQCLYLSEEVEHTPRQAQIELGHCGPLFGQLVVRAALKNTQLTSTITLYVNQDRVDITNELEKVATSEKQELDFAFPFQVPRRKYRLEAPGAILDPEADLLPGAGHAAYPVRHFVDVFNDEFGVTFSQADSGIVELGHRTTAEDPLGPDPANSTVLAMALDNVMDWNEANRNQGGETHFVFRYSLCGHGPGFDPIAALRFAWEDNNALEALSLPAGQEGDLPAAKHGFIRIAPEGTVLTTLKPAEEEGLIARLWDAGGEGTEASLEIAGLGTLCEARQTDLLERDREPLPVFEGQVKMPMRKRGVATARLLI